MLLMGAMATGGTMSILSTLQQGKDAQKIANQNAANLIQQSEDVKKAADEKARIQEAKGIELKEKQKAAFAAGNIKMNVGSPLVIESQTDALIAEDKSYTLMQGRQQRDYLLSEASIQHQMGSKSRKNAKNSAWTTGLMTGASMGFMGYSAGMFGGGVGNYGAATTPANLSKMDSWLGSMPTW